MKPTFFTAKEVARQLGVAPRLISDLFYQGRLDDKECPLVGGKRIIPASFVPKIEKAIREAGKLKE